MSARHTPGPLETRVSALGDVAVLQFDGSIVAECFSQIRHIGEHAQAEALANATLFAGASDLLTAVQPFVATTFAEARAAADEGRSLAYCLADVLNPCWDVERPVTRPLMHWSGLGEACPECNLRAAIAKATGSAS